MADYDGSVILRAVAAVALVAGLAGSLSCREIACEILCAAEVKARRDSPDGKLTAFYVVGNCGATTGYMPIIFLRNAGWPAAACWIDRERLIYSGPEFSEYDIAWTSARALRVTCLTPNTARPYEIKIREGDVDITYEGCPWMEAPEAYPDY